MIGLGVDLALLLPAAVQMGVWAAVKGEPARFRTPQAVYERLALEANEQGQFGPFQGISSEAIKAAFAGGEEPAYYDRVTPTPGEAAVFNMLGVVAPNMKPDENGRIPGLAKTLFNAIPLIGTTVPKYLSIGLDHPDGALTSSDLRVSGAAWAMLAGRLAGYGSYATGESDTIKSIQRPVKANLKTDTPAPSKESQHMKGRK